MKDSHYLPWLKATGITIADVELNLPQGVYLFLGYSEKDEQLLKAVTDQGAEEARGAIQGMVSFHNVNSNKVYKATFEIIMLVERYIALSQILNSNCGCYFITEWMSDNYANSTNSRKSGSTSCDGWIRGK